MAVIAPVTTEQPGNIYHTVWEGIGTGDTGGPVSDLAGASDRSIQVVGDFSGSLSLTIEGSNILNATDNDASYSLLHDVDGTGLTISAEGIEMISENPLSIRINTTSGNGSADVDVHMISRRTG